MTSPSKSKGQPKLKSFHEEKSPKMRMINGQSTESLESLSDELASNSGGNNSTAEPATGRRGHRVGPALYIIYSTPLFCNAEFRETTITIGPSLLVLGL